MRDAQTIFDRYEEIRPRLPRAAFPGRSVEIGSLLDIADEVDAFVFDHGVVIRAFLFQIDREAVRHMRVRRVDIDLVRPRRK